MTQVLLFVSWHFCQHLHRQPVVDHLSTSLAVCQAQLSCALQEHTHTNDSCTHTPRSHPNWSEAGHHYRLRGTVSLILRPRRTHQQLLLGLRSQRAHGQLQSAHRQGVCRDRNAEAFVETHLGLRLQRRTAVKRPGPAGVQWNQVHLHISAQVERDSVRTVTHDVPVSPCGILKK